MLLVKTFKNNQIMIQILLGLALLGSSCGSSYVSPHPQTIETDSAKTIHDFSFKTLNGETKSFSEFKGKKILVVNTASKCGYTKQYEDLEKLFQLKKNKLMIVAFPSDSFFQEYNDTDKIQELCQKFEVSFIVAQPTEVRGKKIDPIFDWLTKQSNPDFTGVIEWNFEKFILDEEGKLIHRYRSKISPLDPSISSLF